MMDGWVDGSERTMLLTDATEPLRHDGASESLILRTDHEDTETF